MSVLIPGQERFGAVTRIVVVDHTQDGGGRVFDKRGVEAELVFQDSMQTCKISLTDKSPARSSPVKAAVKKSARGVRNG